VKVEEFVTHWIKLPKSEQSRLSQFHGNNRLEDEALLGETVLDGQHKIRIHIGPMPLTRYRSLLPGSAAARQLMTWIRNYVGLEFFIDVKMILLKEEVASASLGETTPLGWISWMGERNSELDADDLVLE
jgi:type VI secretion system protein ImpH